MAPIFHLSLSVSDLAAARAFYETTLGAQVGRVTEHWIDLWLFGAQLTAYQRPAAVPPQPYRNGLHFGAVVDWNVWQTLGDRLQEAGVPFRLSPTVDVAGDTAKMMVADPDGYLIEIKAYRDPATYLKQPLVK